MRRSLLILCAMVLSDCGPSPQARQEQPFAMQMKITGGSGGPLRIVAITP